MHRDVSGGVPLHHFELARRHDRLTACVTSRHGGVSVGAYGSLNLAFHVPDEPAAVIENRRRACAALGLPLEALTMARQVHADDIAVVDDTHRGAGSTDDASAVGEADALITATPGVLIGVMVADCVPVVVADPSRRVVAVAHAGWRGTVAKVVTRVVETLIDRFGSAPGDLVAGIGPAIGPASYQIGPEVADAARAAFPANPELLRTAVDGSTHLDLWRANAVQLEVMGVAAERIEVAGVDTRTATDEFFSDRAERPCGRFMALAAIGPSTS
ncbi:MAG: peptidoglycan editing factor PgeF [Actinomycetota bacterium]|nr:peptidoglycan editing factor PgeF [Actinomycetota bacterium]